MEDKNLLEKGGDFLLENSGRALLLGKDPISVGWGVATATTQVIVGGALKGTGKLVKMFMDKKKK